MRFRFCGDLDCPDWVLAEIATLSKLSSVRIKILAVQIISHAVVGEFNYEKVLKLAADNDDGLSNIKGSIAALHFMLHNAAKFDVDDKSFTQEIQQLGLPKENVDAVIKQYRDHKDALRVQLAKESYKVSNLLDVSWRVDQLLGSSEVEETFVEPLAHIKLQVDTQPQRGAITAEQKYNYGNNTDEIILSDGKRIKDVAFEITADKLDILIHELSAAHLALESLQN